MKYLKGTIQQLEAYNNEVTKGENYQVSTKKWDEIQEIEGSFYITFNENYPSELEKVDELLIFLNI